MTGVDDELEDLIDRLEAQFPFAGYDSPVTQEAAIRSDFRAILDDLDEEHLRMAADAVDRLEAGAGKTAEHQLFDALTGGPVDWGPGR